MAYPYRVIDSFLRFYSSLNPFQPQESFQGFCGHLMIQFETSCRLNALPSQYLIHATIQSMHREMNLSFADLPGHDGFDNTFAAVYGFKQACAAADY
jgi:hypothetical protein